MQSSSTAGPPARWIAPSTPPPPRIARLAAFTTASTSCCGDVALDDRQLHAPIVPQDDGVTPRRAGHSPAMTDHANPEWSDLAERTEAGAMRRMMTDQPPDVVDRLG